MQQETKKEPLYKVLNEQRTPGDWIVKNGYRNGQVLPNNQSYIYNNDTMVASIYKNKDAKYTALAVNNLSVLAEALEKCIKFSGKDPQLVRDIAKDALTRIS